MNVNIMFNGYNIIILTTPVVSAYCQTHHFKFTLSERYYVPGSLNLISIVYGASD